MSKKPIATSLFFGLLTLLGACQSTSQQTSSFEINLEPSELQVGTGDSASLQLTLTPIGGFRGTVTLQLENGPTGVSLTPSSINVTTNDPIVRSLTLSTSAQTPANTYNASLKATSSDIVRSRSLRLIVEGSRNISGTVSLDSSIQGGSFPIPRSNSTEPRSTPSEPQAVPGELVVKLRSKDGPFAQTLPRTLQAGAVSLSLVRPMGLPGVGVYRVGEGLSLQALAHVENMEALARAVASLPETEYAHPNYILWALKTPNDPLYSYQWHYDGQHLNLPQAWDIEDGTSRQVVVAVIDTGGLSRKYHPDLTPVQLPGYDLISDPLRAGDGDGRDPDAEDEGYESGYHGAHVAGTIAAATNNSLGVAGVSWGAKIVHVRVLGINGSGSIADVLDGLLWAAGIDVPGVPRNPNPAQVINMSLGGKPSCTQVPSYQQAISQVIAQPQKPVVVVAAGNDQDNASNYTPASCQGVITVGATEFRNYRGFYSNYGPRIDVMAPGGDVTQDQNGDQYPDGVLSTVWDEQFGQPSVDFLNGTSMASPHVAGVVALLKARNPNLGYAEILNILRSTARPLSDQACTGAPHPRVTVSLRSSDCGAGLVDPVRALQAAGGGGSGPGPTPDFSLQLSPASLTLTPGQNAQVNVAVVASGGFNGAVSLSLSGAPAGVTGSFNPNPTTSSSTLSLSVGQGIAPGNYTLSIRGSSGGLTREASLTLSITTQPPPPPPPATIAGTRVFGLYIDQDGNLDENKSTYITITRDERRAPYTLRSLAPGTYLVVGWRDVNQNQEVDDADYLGIYVDSRGNYLVEPPRSGIDFALQSVASLGRTFFMADRMRSWLNGLLSRGSAGNQPQPGG